MFARSNRGVPQGRRSDQTEPWQALDERARHRRALAHHADDVEGLKAGDDSVGISHVVVSIGGCFRFRARQVRRVRRSIGARSTKMKRPSVTLVLLWQEYRAEHADAYGYSRFCDLYGEWRKTISATMRQTHPAGEKLFVDYAGDTVPVYDQITDTQRPAHIFVAALGASNYTYAEARWSEGLADWISAHVNTFTAIGGVPKAVVCDNLRAGVTKPSRYEPGINRTYQDLAEHYGFAVLPARVRKPRDKAKVEVAVLIIERFVLARLRNRRFFSLVELNVAIRECVAALNAKVMRKIGKSRAELLETIDRPALDALPAEPYRYAEWKKCLVAPDYHVEVDKHYYSVPSRLIRATVEARITDTTVEILHQGSRIASHARSQVHHAKPAGPVRK
jgi:transposase